MANIVIQDLTAIIDGTSRYGAPYDRVHVETFIKTDSPISQDLNWFIPNSSIPPELEAFFKATHVEMYPQSEAKLLAGTEDILEQAKSGDVEATEKDASKILQRSLMTLSNLSLIEKTENCYHVSYDYKIYPNSDNSFEFKVVLPFDGLEMVNGSSLVQTTITAPIDSKIDSVKTYGADLATGKEIIQEILLENNTTRRPIVTFQYKEDPIFIINYKY